MKSVSIHTGQPHPGAVEALLRDLPEWFGIEASNRAYVEAARTLPTTAAIFDGEVVGVALVRRHTPQASELELLLVRRDLHRAGIGRQLLTRVEADLRADGVELLQVKTLGPSAASPGYERTRAFYAATGFVPLEERTDIWGPGNPCLISVKVLRDA